MKLNSHERKSKILPRRTMPASDGAGIRGWVAAFEAAKARDSSTELELWRKHSIYRAPACIKELNPKAYKPQVVSLGPFHHGADELAGMEEHKHRALLHLLRRAKKPLDDFVAAMEEVVEQLQSAYQGLGDPWRADSDAFLRLMVVDGCFLLEILRLNVGRLADYAVDDPIFSNHGMLHNVPYIKRDMLIIENQLPLLVLERLVSVETGKPANPDQMNRLVLKLCSPEAPAPIPGIGLALHPLDLYRRSLLQGPSTPSSDLPPRWRSSSESVPSGIIRSAVELYEAGIRFRTSRSSSLHDIHFHHGVLIMPLVVVDDATEYIYLNLMAFERLHVGAGSEVTSYVFFMDNIIDSAKDVSLLHSKGIIQNKLGSDKGVAKLFNSLSKDVTLDPDSSLEAVQRRVNAYCQKSWNMWRANLIHTYFRNPWAFLSLAAAVFLLALSVAQTVYTVLPYYQTGDQAPSQQQPPPPPPAQPPTLTPRRGH